MAAKKLGRPTDNPKTINVQMRFDKETADKLQQCSEKMKLSRSEVVRRAVKRMFDDLE